MSEGINDEAGRIKRSHESRKTFILKRLNNIYLGITTVSQSETGEKNEKIFKRSNLEFIMAADVEERKLTLLASHGGLIGNKISGKAVPLS